MDRQERIDEAIAACTECGSRDFPKRADCDGCASAVDDEIAAETLAAAAPDLLAACQLLDASWTSIIPHGPGEPGEPRLFCPETLAVWRTIRAAISAATGGK